MCTNWSVLECSIIDKLISQGAKTAFRYEQVFECCTENWQTKTKHYRTWVRAEWGILVVVLVFSLRFINMNLKGPNKYIWNLKKICKIRNFIYLTVTIIWVTDIWVTNVQTSVHLTVTAILVTNIWATNMWWAYLGFNWLRKTTQT